MHEQPSVPFPCEVLILTARSEEFLAVLSHLQDVQEVDQGTIYDLGSFPGKHGLWHVAVALIDGGGIAAASEAQKALDLFSPRIALFVGIAGGLKDVQPGDIVVSSKIYAYESGKDAAHFAPRPELWHGHHDLVQRARHEAHSPSWLARLGENRPDVPPQVLIGPLAAGNTLLASKQALLVSLLQANYGDALAIEMEGHGFLQAVSLHAEVHGLVIRGIANLPYRASTL